MTGTSGEFVILLNLKNETSNRINNEVHRPKYRHINLFFKFKKLFFTFLRSNEFFTSNVFVLYLHCYRLLVLDQEIIFSVKQCSQLKLK